MPTPQYSIKSVTASAPNLDITVGYSTAYHYCSALLHLMTVVVLWYTNLPLWLLLPALCFTAIIWKRHKTLYTGRSSGIACGTLLWRAGNTLYWQPASPVASTTVNTCVTSTHHSKAEFISGQPTTACYQCAAFVVVGIAATPTFTVVIPRDAINPAAFRALRARIALHRPVQSLS